MISSIYSTMNDAPLRKIEGKVELYNSSTDPIEFLPTGQLQEVVVSRLGEKGKFFGYGICQQATVKIIDNDPANPLTFLKGESLRTAFRANSTDAYERVCPSFYIKDATRDEKTNIFTITAYDALDSAVSHVFSELELVAPYTLIDVVEACRGLLGLSSVIHPDGFDLSYETGANLGGNENLRAILNAVAEATQTIYYVDSEDNLVFKRLDRDGNPVLVIDKGNYFELTKALSTTITKIMSVTELGDNVDDGVNDNSGVCQYVRDNPFWNARTDLDVLLPLAHSRISGLTVIPFNLRWRGNFLTEVCDKISIQAKDDSYFDTFLLEDSFTYNGGFSQTSSWEYNPDSDRTTLSNPATLGEKLNQTFARVDKVKQEIDLVSKKADEASSEVAEIKVTTDAINLRVEEIISGGANDYTDEKMDSISKELDKLTKEVNLKVSAEDVAITVTNTLNNGVDKVVTSAKKYTLDDTGLNVGSSENSISTTITEDGMRIHRSSQEVLVADNQGVKAEDLHATTYLIIGKNSRFEDWQGNYTACFWIGGN